MDFFPSLAPSSHYSTNDDALSPDSMDLAAWQSAGGDQVLLIYPMSFIGWPASRKPTSFQNAEDHDSTSSPIFVDATTAHTALASLQPVCSPSTNGVVTCRPPSLDLFMVTTASNGVRQLVPTTPIFVGSSSAIVQTSTTPQLLQVAIIYTRHQKFWHGFWIPAILKISSWNPDFRNCCKNLRLVYD